MDIQKCGLGAAEKYLDNKGYEFIAQTVFDGHPLLVCIYEQDEIDFELIRVSGDAMPEVYEPNRAAVEEVIAQTLVQCPELPGSAGIVFNDVSVFVLSPQKAMLRHTIDILGGEPC